MEPKSDQSSSLVVDCGTHSSLYVDMGGVNFLLVKSFHHECYPCQDVQGTARDREWGIRYRE